MVKGIAAKRMNEDLMHLVGADQQNEVAKENI